MLCVVVRCVVLCYGVFCNVLVCVDVLWYGLVCYIAY